MVIVKESEEAIAGVTGRAIVYLYKISRCALEIVAQSIAALRPCSVQSTQVLLQQANKETPDCDRLS